MNDQAGGAGPCPDETDGIEDGTHVFRTILVAAGHDAVTRSRTLFRRPAERLRALNQALWHCNNRPVLVPCVFSAVDLAPWQHDIRAGAGFQVYPTAKRVRTAFQTLAFWQAVEQMKTAAMCPRDQREMFWFV